MPYSSWAGQAGQRRADQAAAQGREEERKRQEAAQCGNAFQPLLTALRELDSRLDIGLNYSEYNERVGDVKVVYDQAVGQGEGGGFDCVSSVGLPLENALQQYARASQSWSKCSTTSTARMTMVNRASSRAGRAQAIMFSKPKTRWKG